MRRCGGPPFPARRRGDEEEEGLGKDWSLSPERVPNKRKSSREFLGKHPPHPLPSHSPLLSVTPLPFPDPFIPPQIQRWRRRPLVQTGNNATTGHQPASSSAHGLAGRQKSIDRRARAALERGVAYTTFASAIVRARSWCSHRVCASYRRRATVGSAAQQGFPILAGTTLRWPTLASARQST